MDWVWLVGNVIVVHLLKIFVAFNESSLPPSQHHSIDSYTEPMNPIYTLFTCFFKIYLMLSSHIPAVHKSRDPGLLKFVRWRLIFVGPQYGTCFVSPF
jgi:hypothetical protein